MKTIKLYNGEAMPGIGLGTWKSEPGEVRQAVLDAVRAGYRHIDCAWIYQNEAEIGTALAELFEEGSVSRDELWITSKLWNDRHAAADVEGACRQTLSDLGLDSLDLYLIHWPVAQAAGVVIPEQASDLLGPDQVPPSETWSAMESLVEAGLCRNIGVSNYSETKLKALLNRAWIKPAVNQIELHPYLQQDDMLEFCQNNGIAVTAYSPLGSGDRPAVFKAADEPVLLEDETIVGIADKHQASPAQVLIAWALARHTVVIPKSVNASRIRDNLAAGELALDAADMQAIAALDRRRRYVDGSFLTLEGSVYSQDSLWD